MKSGRVDEVYVLIKQVELKEKARAFLPQGHSKLSVKADLTKASVRKADLTVQTINLHFLIKTERSL